MAPELVAGGGYGGLIREKPYCAQCGVPVAVGQSADRPVRCITLADNASTTKLKGKQLCASCVIKIAKTILNMKLP